MCLLTETGSCRGCNILEIARKRVHREGTVRDENLAQNLAKPIQQEYCPTGTKMQTSALVPDVPRSIW